MIIYNFFVYIAITENMIYKGLDDEEAVFLQRIADQKAAYNAEVAMLETEELSEFRVSWSHCVFNIYSANNYKLILDHEILLSYLS